MQTCYRCTEIISTEELASCLMCKGKVEQVISLIIFVFFHSSNSFVNYVLFSFIIEYSFVDYVLFSFIINIHSYTMYRL